MQYSNLLYKWQPNFIIYSARTEVHYISGKHAASLHISCKYYFDKLHMQHQAVRHAILLCIICNIAPSCMNDKQITQYEATSKKCNSYRNNMHFRNADPANLKRENRNRLLCRYLLHHYPQVFLRYQIQFDLY